MFVINFVGELKVSLSISFISKWRSTQPIVKNAVDADGLLMVEIIILHRIFTIRFYFITATFQLSQYAYLYIIDNTSWIQDGDGNPLF